MRIVVNYRATNKKYSAEDFPLLTIFLNIKFP